jgi:hypothetical protein
MNANKLVKSLIRAANFSFLKAAFLWRSEVERSGTQR